MQKEIKLDIHQSSPLSRLDPYGLKTAKPYQQKLIGLLLNKGVVVYFE